MHPLFDRLAKDLATDISQMGECGHDEAALTRELDVARATGSLDALATLQEDLWRRPSPPGYLYDEPDDWATISAGFPDPDSHARFAGTEGDLADRLHAAWLGRCAGCQLGKMLEGAWPEETREVLTAAGAWPLTDYVPALDPARAAELARRSETFRKRYRRELTGGNFHDVAPDDDIHYAITGQITLERHGPDFTAEQAIETIIELTPASMVFAAGKNMFRTYLFGLPSSAAAVYGNPCRQSLGAQIRCDPFGWAAPANPALAARMAHRDAANSQVRNGIYSGVFFAVLMADALAHGDAARAIDTAEAYVPPKSQFAEMVAFVKRACAGAPDWQQANEAIYERYDRLFGSGRRAPMNHGLINAAVTVMSLLTGGGDFGRTIGIAVMAGRDTDCNGATAGSIMGCALGTSGIDPRWVEPFNDTIRTSLREMHTVRISDLSRRLLAVAKPNVRWEGGRP